MAYPEDNMVGVLPVERPQPRGIMDYLRDPYIRAALSGASRGFAQAAQSGMPGAGYALSQGLAGASDGATSWEEQQAKMAAQRVADMAAAKRGETDYRYQLGLIAKRKMRDEGLDEESAYIAAQQELAGRPFEQRQALSEQGYQQSVALERLRDKARRGQMITEKDLELAYAPQIAAATEGAKIVAGETARKEMAAPMDIAGARNLIEQLGETRKVAERALAQSDWTTTGPVGAFLRYVPGSDAYDLDATLQTVRSNLGLDTLVALKSQGGTLGAVSEKELDLLLSKVASLNQAQSPDQFKSQLQEVLRMYDRTVRNVQNDLRVKYGEKAQGVKPAQSAPQPPAPKATKRWNPQTGRVE